MLTGTNHLRRERVRHSRSPLEFFTQQHVLLGKPSQFREALWTLRTGTQPTIKPKIDYGACARFMVLGLEVVFGCVVLATKIRQRIFGERHAVDDPRAAMPQHDVLGNSDCRKTVSNHSEPWAHAFTKDIVDSPHPFRMNNEFPQKCTGFAGENGRSITFGIADAFVGDCAAA